MAVTFCQSLLCSPDLVAVSFSQPDLERVRTVRAGKGDGHATCRRGLIDGHREHRGLDADNARTRA